MYRFLIVEDEDAVMGVIGSYITSSFPDAEIITASDGIEALDMLRSGDFDVIVSDWEMPFMQGDELLSNIRSTPGMKDIPFIMVTIRRDMGSMISAIKAGVTDYVSKPVDRKTFLMKVRKAISERPRRGSAKIIASLDLGQALITKKIKDLVNRNKLILPPAPAIITELADIMRNEDIDVREILDLLEDNQAVLFRFQITAGSGLYPGLEQTCTIPEAIAGIGLDETGILMTLIAFRELFKTEDDRLKVLLGSLYQHSIAVGSASLLLARSMGLKNPFECFQLGLFHDIGKLPILQAASSFINDNVQVDHNALLSVVDSQHIKIGGMIMAEWNFRRIYSVVALKHEFSSSLNALDKELRLVSIANRLMNHLGFSMRKAPPGRIPDILKEIPSLDEEGIKDIIKYVETCLQKGESIL